MASDALRMQEQCAIWARWLGDSPALPGRPCCFVNTSHPERVFSVPDGAKDHVTFQPFADVSKNWQRFHTDSFLPGGTGPIPTLRQYLRLLRASRRGASVHIVQVGANLGGDEYNEWVHPLLRANPSWTGVVLEPVSRVFSKLSENYQPERHRVQPMNLAIATRTGPCEMQVNVKNRQTSTLALGDQVHGIKCFTDKRSCRYLKEHSWFQREQVNCSTLEDALAQREPHLQVPVDLLVIDVEMFDYTLLRTSRIDLIRPLVLEFETKAFTMQQGAEVASYLALLGYLCRFNPWQRNDVNDMLRRGRRAWPDEEYGDSAYNRAAGHYNRSEAVAMMEAAYHRLQDGGTDGQKKRVRGYRVGKGTGQDVLVEMGKIGVQNINEAVCYRMV